MQTAAPPVLPQNYGSTHYSTNQKEKRTEKAEYPAREYFETPCRYRSAAVPTRTTLLSDPMPVTSMVTVSPACSVKPMSGTIPVPVERTIPSGYTSPRNAHDTRPLKLRRIRCVLLVPDHTVTVPRTTAQEIASSPATNPSANRIRRCRAQAPAYTFACGR